LAASPDGASKILIRFIAGWSQRRAKRSKSFLVLFFKKELLSSPFCDAEQ
jgi:hypothetical protein